MCVCVCELCVCVRCVLLSDDEIDSLFLVLSFFSSFVSETTAESWREKKSANHSRSVCVCVCVCVYSGCEADERERY